MKGRMDNVESHLCRFHVCTMHEAAKSSKTQSATWECVNANQFEPGQARPIQNTSQARWQCLRSHETRGVWDPNPAVFVLPLPFLASAQECSGICALVLLLCALKPADLTQWLDTVCHGSRGIACKQRAHPKETSLTVRRPSSGDECSKILRDIFLILVPFSLVLCPRVQ